MEKKKSQRQAVYDSSLNNFLDSSRTLFQTKEFADTTIRDIAKQAGKSVGTLYYYFPNGKEDVVRHLLLRDFYEPHLKLQKYIKEHFDDNLADVLHQAYHDFVSIFDTNWYLLATMIYYHRALKNSLAPIMESTIDDTRAIIQEFLEYKGAQGEIHIKDYHNAARLFFSPAIENLIVRYSKPNEDVYDHGELDFLIKLWQQ